MAKKNKQTEIAVEHIATNTVISVSHICATCPYKIYANKDETVTFGTGNIHSNFIFVLPTYDVKARIGYDNLLTLLADSYKDIIGRSMFEDAYITRLVKCNKSAEHNLYQSSIGPCSKFLTYEITRLVGKHILFFGSAYDDYVANADTVGMYIPYKAIHQVYSPAVLFYDNPKIRSKFFEDLSTILSYN